MMISHLHCRLILASAWLAASTPLLAQQARGGQASLIEQLAAAERALAANPTSVDALIWVGRRTAYLGRYQDAIAIYSEGLARHPGDARLYRHRGHRYISTRQFDRAIADLRHAALLTRGQPDQVEPDGVPNARNIPVSTLQSNIWYHLALAHYLKGEFREAAAAWQHDVDHAANADTEVASRYWLWLTLKRLGEERAAARVLRPVTRGMDIIENGSYHRLLLVFKGALPPDSLANPDDPDPALRDATVGYGLGAWHWVSGRRDEALRMWRAVVAAGPATSFGALAAAADLARFASSGGSGAP